MRLAHRVATDRHPVQRQHLDGVRAAVGEAVQGDLAHRPPSLSPVDDTASPPSLGEIIERERALAEPDLFAVGSMLGYDERVLLRWAARAGNPSSDAVVDLGCFLGGSTLSLARGVAAREGAPSPIHVYDRFVYGEEHERTWVPDGMPFAVGASTLPAFERNVRAVRPMLTLHPGDIRAQRWDGAPIGTLFVDIAKTWEVADAVWREFLPALVPGRSIVIQQDLVHWGHPWCAVVMELLADRFEYLGWAWYSSAVYRALRPIAAGDLPASLLRDLSLEDKLALIERAARRLGEPIGGSVRLSGAFAYAAHGQLGAARERVAEIRERYTDELIPHIGEGFAYLDHWLARVEHGEITVT